MNEHLDVLIVGAGLSGVGAGSYLRRKCPWASFAVFESRERMGGTWDLFRYPGVRSDSDMFTLGYSFRPWPSDVAIADGGAILDYIKDTAEAEGVSDKIRYQHKVISANWSSERSVWEVSAQRTDTGELFELTASWLFACTGYYRYDHGYEPDFVGKGDFKGQLIHPQFWPEDLDCADKDVVVIGSGATAVTLVPALAEQARSATMLQRSPTYMASIGRKNPIATALNKLLPEPHAGRVSRVAMALFSQGMYKASRRWPERMKKLLIGGVQRQLPGYDVSVDFTPRYNPWDQRLCAVTEGDLFARIREGKAAVVTDTIERFTERGIKLSSGRELPADIIVSATGLELLLLGDMQLSIDGVAQDLSQRLAYKGMMCEGIPNMAMAIGYTNASWTLKCDLTCDYVCRILNRLRATGQTQVMPVNSDPTMTPEPLLGLTSGYVQRSQAAFPKQGSRFPWRVYQSWLKDYRALKLRGVDDEGLVFSSGSAAERRDPAPVGAGV